MVVVCRSRARARAQARTQSCSRRPSKPQVSGQLLPLSFSYVRVCAVARLSGVEYSNAPARGRDKGSTPKYAAGTGGAAVAIR